MIATRIRTEEGLGAEKGAFWSFVAKYEAKLTGVAERTGKTENATFELHEPLERMFTGENTTDQLWCFFDDKNGMKLLGFALGRTYQTPENGLGWFVYGFYVSKEARKQTSEIVELAISHAKELGFDVLAAFPLRWYETPRGYHEFAQKHGFEVGYIEYFKDLRGN